MEFTSIPPKKSGWYFVRAKTAGGRFTTHPVHFRRYRGTPPVCFADLRPLGGKESTRVPTDGVEFWPERIREPGEQRPKAPPADLEDAANEAAGRLISAWVNLAGLAECFGLSLDELVEADLSGEGEDGE